VFFLCIKENGFYNQAPNALKVYNNGAETAQPGACKATESE
jgi:hypothetical protein